MAKSRSAADRILLAIANLGDPHTSAILDEVNRDVKPNWLTRCLPSLEIFQGLSIGGFYVHLARMETAGLLQHEYSAETFPERGGRRRLYYRITQKGWHRVRQLDPK